MMDVKKSFRDLRLHNDRNPWFCRARESPGNQRPAVVFRAIPQRMAPITESFFVPDDQNMLFLP
jgi:hypothetical protein